MEAWNAGMMVFEYKLLATGYWLLAAGFWSLASGCWLLVSGSASSQQAVARGLGLTLLHYSSTPTLHVIYLRSNIFSNHFNDSLLVILSLLATAGENTANVPVARAQQTSSLL